jgi:hypothetical protein
LLGAFTAAASPITVTNFSLENISPLTSLTRSFSGGTFANQAIFGWTGSGSSGPYRPNASAFTTIPDGTTVAYSDGNTLSQIVAVVQAGFTYTLMVDLGHRRDLAFLSEADLRVDLGGTTVASAPLAPTPGNWVTYTASFVGSNADLGKAIIIALVSHGHQGDFDNVRFDATAPLATAAPEPAGVTLLGLGLAGLLGFARRKRAS